MNRKIDLLIDTALLKKSGLTTIQYLLIAYLRQDINITFSSEEKVIIDKLERFGYIRIIEEHIIVDPKVESIFETNYSADAREVLQMYNDLKKEHLNIGRPTRANKYVVKFKSLLVQNYSKSEIKEILTYLFETWKNDSFYKKYLVSIDTIVRNWDKYAGEYEMVKNEFTYNKNTML